MPFALDSLSPIQKRLNGAVVGLGASKTAVVTIPTGPTYRGLILKATIAGTAATAAELRSMWTQLRLVLSGTEIFTLTPTQLMAIVEFYRTTLIGDTGYLYIPFARLWMRDEAAALGGSIGTQGETSFSLEITQDSTTTIDLVEVFAVQSPKAEPLGAHVRLVRLTPALPAAGLNSWAGLPKSPQGYVDYLLALHLQVSTSADLTGITYVADGNRIQDLVTQAALGRMYAEVNPPRTMQSGTPKIISLDFCRSGLMRDAIPLTMDEQILETTFANAPTVFNVIAEIATQRPTQAGLLVQG